MTGSREASMIEGDWQARAQQRKRRLYIIIAILFGMGLFSGFLVGFFEKDDSGLMAQGSIPPEIAIITTVIFGIAITFGAVRFHRSSDELERRNMLYAAAMAGNVALGVIMTISLVTLGWPVGIVVACAVPLTLVV